MGTKATLENVRTAHDQLVAEGEIPSANKVLERTGGSKTTVLKRLGEVQGGVPASDDAASAFLHEIAAPLLRRIWTAAKSQAEADNKRRVDALLSVQEAQQEEITTLKSSLDQWQARAISAEDQLRSRSDHGDQVKELMRVVDELKQMHPSSPIDRPLVDKNASSALATMLDLLSSQSRPMTRDALDRAVGERGHPDAAVQKARFHALEVGSIGFCLTEKGRQKLNR